MYDGDMSRGSAISTTEDVLYGDFRRTSPTIEAPDIELEIHRDKMRELTKEIDAEYKELEKYEQQTGGDTWDERKELSDRWEYEIFLPNVVPASAGRYRHWLEQWDQHGRQSSAEHPLVTSTQETTFDETFDKYYVAIDWTIAWPRHGSAAYNLIVPEEIEIDIHAGTDQRPDWILGHSSILWERDWSHQGLVLPLYADVQLP